MLRKLHYIIQEQDAYFGVAQKECEKQLTINDVGVTRIQWK